MDQGRGSDDVASNESSSNDGGGHHTCTIRRRKLEAYLVLLEPSLDADVQGDGYFAIRVSVGPEAVHVRPHDVFVDEVLKVGRVLLHRSFILIGSEQSHPNGRGHRVGMQQRNVANHP